MVWRCGLLICGLMIATAPGALAQSQPSDCASELTRIRKAETELPKLEVAPPGDRQIVCITLETNVLFARRLAAHIQKCPRSPYARSAGDWNRKRAGYSAQFNERGCKPTIRGYRG